MQDEWIPVTETLPPSDTWVLASLGKNSAYSWIAKAMYQQREDLWVDEHCFRIVDVTAWMPLPKPYKEADKC